MKRDTTVALVGALAIVFTMGGSVIAAVDYFADGCSVVQTGGKLIKTDYGYRKGNTVRCQQMIIHTERGRERARTDDFAST